MLGFLAVLRQPEAVLPHNCKCSRAFLEVGSGIEHTPKLPAIWLTTGFLTREGLLKLVDGQDDVEMVCKTLRECRDDVLGLSVEDKRQLEKELMGRQKAKSITLPGKCV